MINEHMTSYLTGKQVDFVRDFFEFSSLSRKRMLDSLLQNREKREACEQRGSITFLHNLLLMETMFGYRYTVIKQMYKNKPLSLISLFILAIILLSGST